MTTLHPLDALTAAMTPLEMTDTISAAGRKIILGGAIRILALEDGVRRSDDPEFVHDMRVATRRMRSALRLLSGYYPTRRVKKLMRSLRWLARALGKVRDLDVLLADLHRRDDPALGALIEAAQAKRAKALRKLNAALDSSDYAALISRLTAFALDQNDPLVGLAPMPVEVRHVLPVLLHQQLAMVRGFDSLFTEDSTPDYETFHALRIAFKQLRYATSDFLDLLGGSAEAFISEMKAVQDHLGRLNDVVVFANRLRGEAADEPAAQATIDALDAEAAELAEAFLALWQRFNSRAVQKYLADSLLTLR